MKPRTLSEGQNLISAASNTWKKSRGKGELNPKQSLLHQGQCQPVTDPKFEKSRLCQVQTTPHCCFPGKSSPYFMGLLCGTDIKLKSRFCLYAYSYLCSLLFLTSGLVLSSQLLFTSKPVDCECHTSGRQWWKEPR